MNLDEQLQMATAEAQAVVQPTQTAPVQQVVQPVQQTQTAPVQPVQQQVVQPIQQPVQQQVVQPIQQPIQQPVASGIDLNKAQVEAETNYAVGVLEFGQKLSNRPIDKLPKVEKGHKIRVTVVGAPFFVNVHKVEINGYDTLIQCMSDVNSNRLEQCCTDDPEGPRTRIAVPVMVYPTLPTDTSSVIPTGQFELKLMVLWDHNSWESIKDEISELGQFEAFNTTDFIATAENSYGSLRFKATKQSFRNEYAQHVINATNKYNNVGIEKASSVVARKYTPEQYANLTLRASIPEQQNYQIDDVV